MIMKIDENFFDEEAPFMKAEEILEISEDNNHLKSDNIIPKEKSPNKKDESELLHGTLILTVEGFTSKVKEAKCFMNKETKFMSYELGDVYRNYLINSEDADEDFEYHDENFYMNFNFYSSDILDNEVCSKFTSIHFIPMSEIDDFTNEVEKEIRRLKLSATINSKTFDSTGGINSYYNEIVKGKALGGCEVYHDI